MLETLFSSRTINREQYHQLVEIGVLHEDDRVELIEGEVLEMSPIGKLHSSLVDYLNALFTRKYAGDWIVRVQSSVVLSELTEPEPDLCLLKPRDDYYASESAGPPDVLLLVEVMNTSQERDTLRKVPVYARHNIAYVWLIDIPTQSVTVYTQPSEGQFQHISHHTAGQLLTIPGESSPTLSVEEIFAPLNQTPNR